ncbi:MAG: DUF6461 domain-containing protein [Actinomycetota bacterium]|nr:DUF6461 domain-containing protein [Actinomycetota bacterium]
MWQLTEKYAWADEDSDFVWTIAVVAAISVDELVRVYGGDPERSELLTFDDAWPSQEDFGTSFTVQMFTEGGYTVAIEPNGWTGDLPEIARRASGGGSFVSAYWSMSGAYRITEACDGKVSAHFDPFAVGYPGGMGDLQPDWIEEMAFDIDRPNASCLAAVEHRTGLMIEQDWLTRQLPTYRIPDPDLLVQDVRNARVP